MIKGYNKEEQSFVDLRVHPLVMTDLLRVWLDVKLNVHVYIFVCAAVGRQREEM